MASLSPKRAAFFLSLMLLACVSASALLGTQLNKLATDAIFAERSHSLQQSESEHKAKRRSQLMKEERRQLNDHILEHHFEGCSVWLEFDEEVEASLSGCMKDLTKLHGGEETGVHNFVPHCTLLYNIPVESLLSLSQTKRVDLPPKSTEKELREISIKLLRKCRQNFWDSWGSSTDAARQMGSHLQPQSLYSFAYPKWADNNKGFHASILMLLLCPKPERRHLEQTHSANMWLHTLYRTAKEVFPSDERHGTHTSTIDMVSTNSRSAETSILSPPPFQPHVSLLYAPLSHARTLSHYVSQIKCGLINKESLTDSFTASNNVVKVCLSNLFNGNENKPRSRSKSESDTQTNQISAILKVNGGSMVGESHLDRQVLQRLKKLSSPSIDLTPKYVSVWRTKGRISDWRRVARIPLYKTP